MHIKFIYIIYINIMYKYIYYTIYIYMIYYIVSQDVGQIIQSGCLTPEKTNIWW